MAFLSSLDIGGSALSAERLRVDIINQNIANQNTYNTADGDPYRRQLVVFQEKKTFKETLSRFEQEAKSSYSRGTYYLARKEKYQSAGVEAVRVTEDMSPFIPVYDPNNPLADENGYIYKSNVNNTKEQIDLMVAQRAYEANVAAIAAVKAMATKAMSLTGR
ncbi:MAG: flagellar basal body rod protein FlgC [Oscillospiraceae bacterium]|nr:flagellar basal body rod protein FlgC [Oscillospiraceae bacterium]